MSVLIEGFDASAYATWKAGPIPVATAGVQTQSVGSLAHTLNALPN
ncbi:hypothetical protein [Alkalicoccobacillus gibsonii]|nr:hypothetical protein [Alkalicoccobacillus gibsonii]